MAIRRIDVLLILNGGYLSKLSERHSKHSSLGGSHGYNLFEAEFKQGEKMPILLTLDKQTKELVPFRKDWVKVPEVFKEVRLSEEQKQRLGNGEGLTLP